MNGVEECGGRPGQKENTAFFLWRGRHSAASGRDTAAFLSIGMNNLEESQVTWNPEFPTLGSIQLIYLYVSILTHNKEPGWIWLFMIVDIFIFYFYLIYVMTEGFDERQTCLTFHKSSASKYYAGSNTSIDFCTSSILKLLRLTLWMIDTHICTVSKVHCETCTVTISQDCASGRE